MYDDFWSFQSDYLTNYHNAIASEQLKNIRSQRLTWLEEQNSFHWAKLIADLPQFKSRHLVFNQDVVEIGNPEELSFEQLNMVNQTLKAFMPWKKGPFKIFGTSIDAEWRSDVKWARIVSHIVSLQGKRVADIGCHNGYFMFRMAAHNPELVIGFEPVSRHFYNFAMLQRFAQVPQLYFELLGVERIHFYPNFFDTVFCLGILYHHRDPIGLLTKINASLKAGGQLIVECQGIPGDMSVALFPEKRYAKSKSHWFLPTVSCLANWLKRARFERVRCFYSAYLSTDEQRTTDWAPIESLKDFLDSHDKTKTVEGYPAPIRIYISAVKR